MTDRKPHMERWLLIFEDEREQVQDIKNKPPESNEYYNQETRARVDRKEVVHLIEMSAVTELLEALELALQRHDEHSQAYPLDIFPDDGRPPCETTSGRMGRHMVKCYEQYLAPARAVLTKFREGKGKV